jgi:hypothetical protein
MTKEARRSPTSTRHSMCCSDGVSSPNKNTSCGWVPSVLVVVFTIHLANIWHRKKKLHLKERKQRKSQTDNCKLHLLNCFAVHCPQSTNHGENISRASIKENITLQICRSAQVPSPADARAVCPCAHHVATRDSAGSGAAWLWPAGKVPRVRGWRQVDFGS